MPRIALETTIRADVARCFDLARDLDLHRRSMEHTGERAVGGRTSGLIELGESVTWRARHFGVVLEHTSEITAFDRPRQFRDEMRRGRFRSFRHDHVFEPVPGGTRMVDVIEYAAPFGLLGRVAERLFLTAYLRRLLERRNDAIRRAAESPP